MVFVGQERDEVGSRRYRELTNRVYGWRERFSSGVLGLRRLTTERRSNLTVRF